MYQRKLVDKICGQCGVDFKSVKKKALFCSTSCSGAAKAKSSATRTCQECKVEFTNRVERRTVFCSRTCGTRHGSRKRKSYRGGISRVTGGYLRQEARDHPKADQKGYVMQHRLVVEKQLGRALEAGEFVHHKNGVRSDNRPENLELWTTGHKDPKGVRLKDHARDVLSRMDPKEQSDLIAEFKNDDHSSLQEMHGSGH